MFAHTAALVNPTEIETEDTVAASLEMADASLACLAVTTGSSTEISRHRFCFSHLTAESNTQPYTNTSDPWTFTGDSPELQRRINEALSRFSPQPEGYVGQFARFHAAVQEGAEPPVTIADARAALELITALYHTAETGRPVILPISEDHSKYQGWQPQTG